MYGAVSQLNEALLHTLPKEVDPPRYDRSRVESGVVHFGVGHFHRAHQAVYFDDLLRLGRAQWGICGVGIRASSERVRSTLGPQDWLYTVTEKFASGQYESRIIGSLIEFLTPVDGTEAIVAKIADPATQVVSLTVTEGGYGLDPASGEFTGQGELVQADLRGESARSWIGLLLQAIAKRKASGLGGLTVVSCDNIVGNGHAAKAAVLGYAALRAPDLSSFVEDELAFPNSMVDRVVPATTGADEAYLEKRFGYLDAWPVTCEPVSYWVLEDQFSAGRPPLEDVGVEMVGDVRPYEKMKLRIANGAHQCLCYFGSLLGYRFVHEAIADPDIKAMLLRYFREEAVPTLERVPGLDTDAFALSVLERFGNPEISDPLSRICEDSTDRLPKFLLPVVADQVRLGGPIEVGTGVIASWARFLEGTDERGRRLDVKDPRRARLLVAARRQAGRPTALIDEAGIFGDLASSTAFRSAYVQALDTLRRSGARGLLSILGER
ncbi:MAG: mannitol dehydrogenase-like protein [Acidimicrobiaceae bacterium]|nr:mannitol dehydrogenase-like protein [Acidimicrobiaceae bacterium]